MSSAEEKSFKVEVDRIREKLEEEICKAFGAKPDNYEESALLCMTQVLAQQLAAEYEMMDVVVHSLSADDVANRRARVSFTMQAPATMVYIDGQLEDLDEEYEVHPVASAAWQAMGVLQLATASKLPAEAPAVPAHSRTGTTPAGPQKARLVACKRSQYHDFHPENEECPMCGPGMRELQAKRDAEKKEALKKLGYGAEPEEKKFDPSQVKVIFGDKECEPMYYTGPMYLPTHTPKAPPGVANHSQFIPNVWLHQQSSPQGDWVHKSVANGKDRPVVFSEWVTQPYWMHRTGLFAISDRSWNKLQPNKQSEYLKL
jgi:ribosomal protein L37E